MLDFDSSFNTVNLENVNVKSFRPLTSPWEIKTLLPSSPDSQNTTLKGREAIKKILDKGDNRLLVIAGPCSIHDEAGTIDFAERLKNLKNRVQDKIEIVMRVYFEKPRTIIGWKGLINDPWLNGSYDVVEGMKKARGILLKITEMGISTATEILEPITPQYILDLVSWVAIGARTIESQTHRQMASGLSTPVGFKNGTDGAVCKAINAIEAAMSSQTFLGINEEGQTCIVETNGNKYSHLIMRGGDNRPNYDSYSIEEAVSLLKKRNLPTSIIVDCSHGNSRKKYRNQKVAFQDVVRQRASGNRNIIGLMLESNIKEGAQEFTSISQLKYGVSITDACIGWEENEELILWAADQL